MKMIILDYSDYFYKNVAKTAIPPVRSGKFVHILSPESEYLIFSPKLLSPYHADIVERFCNQHEIDGYYDKGQYVYIIHDNRWKVLGGGKWLMDDREMVLNLFDDSKAYGKFDSIGMVDKITSDIRFSGYKIFLDKA
ncbi:MAG: hypothetical protein HQK91_12940 [Nitrospirae bacterium]|nr:hypothetical protein [Nitrospirota bacterium]